MFSLKIAKRFITSNKLQSFFIILGIAVGLSVQIFIGILIDSLQSSLVNKTVGRSPHVTITSSVDKNTISDWNHILSKAKNVNGVKITEVTAGGNAFIIKDSKNFPVLIRGFQLGQSDVYRFKDSLYEGQLPKSDNEIILGKDLSQELGSKVGDNISIFTPNGQKNDLKISGFYDLKVANLNKSWAITNLATAQNIFGLSKNVTAIEIQVDNVFNADKIADNIKLKLSTDGLKIENWKNSNQDLLSGLQGQSISSLIIQIFVLLAVVIAITSILSITVMQKSRQIGILKAMGITDKEASKIFIFQGFIYGIFGSVLGLLLGLGLFFAFVTFVKTPEGVSIVEPNVRISFVVLTGIIAITAATFAGLIPAYKSSKLNPIEVIKNG